MVNFKFFLICGSAISLTFACVTKVIQQSPPSPLVKILKDRTLWGKDYPAALAYLASWNKIGERKVVVFPNRVIGATRYKTREEAQRAARELARALKEPRPEPDQRFEELLKEVRKAPPPFRADTVTFQEDDSKRVAWVGQSLQFLIHGLTLETVRDHLGPAEKVTREIVSDEQERRPVILTLYRYAEGAIIFAESNWAPRPGFVDRVLLDIPTVTGVVFK